MVIIMIVCLMIMMLHLLMRRRRAQTKLITYLLFFFLLKEGIFINYKIAFEESWLARDYITFTRLYFECNALLLTIDREVRLGMESISTLFSEMVQC